MQRLGVGRAVVYLPSVPNARRCAIGSSRSAGASFGHGTLDVLRESARSKKAGDHEDDIPGR